MKKSYETISVREMLLMKFLFLNSWLQIILKSQLTEILETRYVPGSRSISNKLNLISF